MLFEDHPKASYMPDPEAQLQDAYIAANPRNTQCHVCLSGADSNGRVPISSLACSPQARRCVLLEGHAGAHEIRVAGRKRYWYGN